MAFFTCSFITANTPRTPAIMGITLSGQKSCASISTPLSSEVPVTAARSSPRASRRTVQASIRIARPARQIRPWARFSGLPLIHVGRRKRASALYALAPCLRNHASLRSARSRIALADRSSDASPHALANRMFASAFRAISRSLWGGLSPISAKTACSTASRRSALAKRARRRPRLALARSTKCGRWRFSDGRRAC